MVRPPIAQVNRLAAELRSVGRDIVDLGQAILGLPPPAEAISAVQRMLTEPSIHGYSPDPGLPELREALAGFLRGYKGIEQADPERVMVTCGANQAFANALLTITRPGDEVVTFAPGYFDHGYVIALASCRQREVELRRRAGRYEFDIDAVERVVGPRTRCIVLVSPGNPTGAVADAAFVEALTGLCRSRGLWLVSDETYDLLTFDPVVHVSPGRARDSEHVIVVGSFSKTFALAGWRIGYCYGPASFFEQQFKVQDGLVVCAPVPSQRALVGALGRIDPFVEHARQELRRRRDALIDGLAAVDTLEASAPEGATFVLARIVGGSARGGDCGAEPKPVDDVAFCEHLLRQAGVVGVPGSAFGRAGAGAVRLSFGNQPVDRLAEAARRLRSMRWP